MSTASKNGLKPIAQQLKQLCNYHGSVAEFKAHLARFITTDTAVYAELKACVF